MGRQIASLISGNKTGGQTIRRLSPFNIYFAEQPVADLDMNWLVDVRRHVDVPIMADESIYTLQDAMAMARTGVADILPAYVRLRFFDK